MVKLHIFLIIKKASAITITSHGRNSPGIQVEKGVVNSERAERLKAFRTDDGLF